MNFIKDFSQLNVHEAFKTLFPSVNEEGQIVFNSSVPQENQQEILNIFKRHIDLSQGNAKPVLSSGGEELSLEERRQWLRLIQQVEEMSSTSTFCKALLNTVQNVVLGKICANEETTPPINIFYKEVEHSHYLKKALFENWATGNEGVIHVDLEQVEEIREYLDNREHLEKTTDLSRLIYYYKSASFLADDRGEKKFLV